MTKPGQLGKSKVQTSGKEVLKKSCGDNRQEWRLDPRVKSSEVSETHEDVTESNWPKGLNVLANPPLK
jgi:hypothetical protein